MKIKKIHIIGGGLAGLTAALHLLKSGFKVTVFEKNSYPKHKVCGEYISNEVLPYLKSLDVDPMRWGAVIIKKLQCSSINGNILEAELPLGGFGLSRYIFDLELYKAVLAEGGEILQEQVENIVFNGKSFKIETFSNKEFEAEIVMGAYGKRANLDVSLSRKFIRHKSPWMAVKSHYSGDFQADLVGLHNFKGGYCGISRVENNAINVCYLARLDSFQQYKDLDRYRKEVLRQNKYLDAFFEQAEPIFEKPLTISQISFDSKERVVNRVLMCGDSASLIHPLCGNGMAMAIVGARILSECVIFHLKHGTTRDQLEASYSREWAKQFRSRLEWGRGLQKVLTNPTAANIGIATMQHTPWLFQQLIKKTHGKPSAA
ncbi:MAG TPA: NAD(P)/FAD-dependent oxidoreductase [Leeuwenhoekiella sp.]|nr:NAD(P)/FAD-dependent oxidoreductase [Leeuwenhoekiella sp.]